MHTKYYNIYPMIRFPSLKEFSLPLQSLKLTIKGKMPEWSNGTVSKTVVPFGYPGFESLSFRKPSLKPASAAGFSYNPQISNSS